MPTEILIRTTLNLLIFQVPLIIIAGIGLWFAATRKQIPARVAMCAKWGFGLLIAYSLASVTLSVLTLQLRVAARTESASIVSENLLWLNLIGLGAYPVFIAGIAFVARAVFLDR